jgi:hypothetical protein
MFAAMIACLGALIALPFVALTALFATVGPHVGRAVSGGARLVGSATWSGLCWVGSVKDDISGANPEPASAVTIIGKIMIILAPAFGLVLLVVQSIRS